ncbi:hypothetical protein PTKIN_Ptkin05aG0057000 [Pterospermum kingtungense]
MLNWIFGRNGPSGFSASSTAEEVTQGIDATGLTAIVTGASSGIGVETTRVLALRGVHVVVAVRNVDAGRNVREALLEEIPGAKIDVMELDLSSMASHMQVDITLMLLLPFSCILSFTIWLCLSVNFIKFFYEKTNTYLSLFESNNAEVMATPFMSFSFNKPFVVGDYENTARESNIEGRIVILSSEGHRFAYREGFRFDEINYESSYNSWFAYGQSKLANISHAKELAKHLKEDGVEITANSLHPGNIMTNLIRRQGLINRIGYMFGKYFLKTIPQRAATTCYVAFAFHPQVKGVSGEYFWDSNIGKPSSKANDADLAKRLWDFSLTLTNPK